MLEEIMIAINDDRPGILAEIGELLGRAGVNIGTLAATNIDGKGVVHLVVDDGDDAGEVLLANGFDVQGSRSVLTATLEDRPGELGRYCRRLAEAGVAISSAYVARRGGGESELIIAVDDYEAAEQA
ncbi:MAG TPA: ACT domain-containing protein [Actinomycetota bacterium]|nr:ACT domain-containing protein [Actinomycetota bacterium]